jgi:hypothetical protein
MEGQIMENSKLLIDETRHTTRHYRYLIRIEGHLNNTWSEWLGGMEITTEITSNGPETVMEGFVADQAALHGLLMKLNNLNLPLITVQRLGPVRTEV